MILILRKIEICRQIFYLNRAKAVLKTLNFMIITVVMLLMLIFQQKKRLKNSAIITLDSEGDGLNQTVWIVDKRKK